MIYIAFGFLTVVIYYTRRDWTLKPSTLLQWYLLFTIVFYFYRWTFQLGPPETTAYDQDAPLWVRIIKDFVYLVLVAIWTYKGKFRYSRLIWYLIPFAVWFSLASYLKLMSAENTDDILFHWHMSLEYMPLAFLVLEEDAERFLKFAIGCSWVVIGFLILEAFSGRVSGFFKDELLFSRYGSIFGSPNELGAFTVLTLIGMLVFADKVPTTTKVFLLPAMSVTLVLSGSRSAILGLVAGLVAIWPKSKTWLASIAAAGVVLYIWLFSVIKDAPLADSLVARIADPSASARIDQFAFVRHVVNNWGIGDIFLGEWGAVDQENYYFSILMRAGFLGVALFCIVLLLTIMRARHPFLRAGIVSILAAACFVPYLDIYPINVYFWLMTGAAWSSPECRHARDNLLPSGLSLMPGSQRLRT